MPAMATMTAVVTEIIATAILAIATDANLPPTILRQQRSMIATRVGGVTQVAGCRFEVPVGAGHARDGHDDRSRDRDYRYGHTCDRHRCKSTANHTPPATVDDRYSCWRCHSSDRIARAPLPPGFPYRE